MHHYAARNLTAYLARQEGMTYPELADQLTDIPERIMEWENLGGQLVPVFRVTELREAVRNGTLNSWEDIHSRYDDLNRLYDEDTLHHSWAVYCMVVGDNKPSTEMWDRFLKTAVAIQRQISRRVYQSRRKDYENPFRIATYRNTDEMAAAIGTVDDNSFIKRVADETTEFNRLVNQLLKR